MTHPLDPVDLNKSEICAQDALAYFAIPNITMMSANAGRVLAEDVIALIAEVRALRAELAARDARKDGGT